jgi:hypothetical protein
MGGKPGKKPAQINIARYVYKNLQKINNWEPFEKFAYTVTNLLVCILINLQLKTCYAPKK